MKSQRISRKIKYFDVIAVRYGRCGDIVKSKKSLHVRYCDGKA
jgi:hypothetical protein